MNIAYRTNKLQKVFCSEKKLTKTFGTENAKKIRNRMAVLWAAKNLAEVPTVPPMRRHQLGGNYEDHFAVDVKHPFRLIFRPMNDPLPKLADGGIDLNAITEIEIVIVKDYH